MLLSGSLIVEGRHIQRSKSSCEDPNKDFHSKLEESFISLCKDLKISVPLWLDKNTRELAMCKKTSFYPDQFDDVFIFDKFEMRIDKI
jgi:hypothetical protein